MEGNNSGEHPFHVHPLVPKEEPNFGDFGNSDDVSWPSEAWPLQDQFYQDHLEVLPQVIPPQPTLGYPHADYYRGYQSEVPQEYTDGLNLESNEFYHQPHYIQGPMMLPNYDTSIPVPQMGLPNNGYTWGHEIEGLNVPRPTPQEYSKYHGSVYVETQVKQEDLEDSDDRSSDGSMRASRDQKKARELKIDIPVEEIVTMPIDEFNDLMAKKCYSEVQLTLMRDIRRRGKNKLAAQNCRKRKLGHIKNLSIHCQKLRQQRNMARKADECEAIQLKDIHRFYDLMVTDYNKNRQ